MLILSHDTLPTEIPAQQLRRRRGRRRGKGEARSCQSRKEERVTTLPQHQPSAWVDSTARTPWIIQWVWLDQCRHQFLLLIRFWLINHAENITRFLLTGRKFTKKTSEPLSCVFDYFCNTLVNLTDVFWGSEGHKTGHTESPGCWNNPKHEMVNWKKSCNLRKRRWPFSIIQVGEKIGSGQLNWTSRNPI